MTAPTAPELLRMIVEETRKRIDDDHQVATNITTADVLTVLAQAGRHPSQGEPATTLAAIAAQFRSRAAQDALGSGGGVSWKEIADIFESVLSRLEPAADAGALDVSAAPKWACLLYDLLRRDYEAEPTSGEIVTADVREVFNGVCGYIASFAEDAPTTPPPWEPSKMRTFTMYRRDVPTATHDENQRNSPDEPAFEGVVFSDGSVALRWMTAIRSTSVWASLDDALKIHGHPEYKSELVFHDAVMPAAVAAAKRQAYEKCAAIAQEEALKGMANRWRHV